MIAQTVAVDFDGVLHSYTNSYDSKRLDGPEPGAVEFVEGLLDSGYAVLVHSTRANDAAGYQGMVRWLQAHGFPVDRMRIHVGNGKPPAIAYVDDRAVPYDRTVQYPWESVRSSVDWLAVQGPHAGS